MLTLIVNVIWLPMMPCRFCRYKVAPSYSYAAAYPAPVYSAAALPSTGVYTRPVIGAGYSLI